MRVSSCVKTACIVTVLFTVLRADVVITELHRDPSSGNKNAIPGGYSHSFVEVTNFGADTFFVRDVFLTNGKVVDSVMLFGGIADVPISGHEDCVFDAAYIPPGGIAVILPQNYIAGISASPETIHPIAPGTIVLTVNRKNLGGGMANDDGAALYRGTRAQIDSLIDIAADSGIHISAPLSGKILLTARQTKGVSVIPTSLLLGTRRYAPPPAAPLSPGRYESLQNGVYTEYSLQAAAAGSVQCSIAGMFVNNIDGINTINGDATWRLGSRLSTYNTIDIIDTGVFGSGRKFLLSLNIPIERSQHIFEITRGSQIITSTPIDLSAFWAGGGTLRITEIYPKGGGAAAGQPEWFEVMNVSPADVNLNGWMFGNSKDSVVITASDIFLQSGDYAVVCKDSAAMRVRYRAARNLIRPQRWHTLNSYNDTLILYTRRGVEVDAVVYRSAWFTKWTIQSLERVGGGGGADSASWVLCDRPTPGAPGRAETWRAVSAPSIEIGPTPFTPNGDGIDDLLAVRIKTPPGYKVNIRLFAFNGKLIKTFTDGNDVIYWNGLMDSNRPAAPGMFYIVAEFTSGATKKIIRKKGVLWR